MRQPKDYFTEISIDRGFADSLDSQWIPTDPTLWEIDNFQDFLSRRRELLADAANHFLADLKGGQVGCRAPSRTRRGDNFAR